MQNQPFKLYFMSIDKKYTEQGNTTLITTYTGDIDYSHYNLFYIKLFEIIFFH